MVAAYIDLNAVSMNWRIEFHARFAQGVSEKLCLGRIVVCCFFLSALRKKSVPRTGWQILAAELANKPCGYVLFLLAQ